MKISQFVCQGTSVHVRIWYSTVNRLWWPALPSLYITSIGNIFAVFVNQSGAGTCGDDWRVFPIPLFIFMLDIYHEVCAPHDVTPICRPFLTHSFEVVFGTWRFPFTGSQKTKFDPAWKHKVPPRRDDVLRTGRTSSRILNPDEVELWVHQTSD